MTSIGSGTGVKCFSLALVLVHIDLRGAHGFDNGDLFGVVERLFQVPGNFQRFGNGSLPRFCSS